ncbi:MAG: MTH1187 family thiamine-binding protein [Methanotrichaceae archaeon]
MDGKDSSKVFYTFERPYQTHDSSGYPDCSRGHGTSMSQHVKAVHDILDEEGIKYIPGPMSTALEVDSLDDLFDVIEQSNQVLTDRGVQRVLTTINIDYRLDKEISMKSKLGICKNKLKC